MSSVAHAPIAPPTLLDFQGDMSLGTRNWLAVKDLVDGIRLWPLAQSLGWLDIRRGPDFGPGTYALFDFGTLVDHGLSLGESPEGYLYSVVTDAVHHPVDLIVSAPAPVPEPSGLVVMGLVGTSVVAAGRRRARGTGTALAA